MNKTELQKLIREEVRKVIKERSSLNEIDEKKATEAILGIKLMMAAFKQMPANEAETVKLFKGHLSAGLTKMLADAIAKGTTPAEKLELIKGFSKKLDAANTVDAVGAAMIEIIETLREYK